MTIFKGCGVAVVTPFDNDGKFNSYEYENLINFLISNGADAIVSCGTTGEASTLSSAEKTEVIKCCVDIVNKRVPVIAGTGTNCTENAVNATKEAYKAGVDACLLVTPYYNKTTQKGLIKHFESIAASADLPLILYSVPSRTGLNITPQTAYALSKTENIAAIKEASGDITQIAQIAALCGDDLQIYSGNDDQTVSILSLGGIGVISVLGNIAPKNVHDMVFEYLEGDRDKALKLQLEAMTIIKALFCEVNPIPVKQALNLMGKNVGSCRMPLCEMEEANVEFLKKEMQKYGLI